MKELYVLLMPAVLSLKNDIVRFSLSFYKKSLVYIISGSLFMLLMTKLLNAGMIKLQGMSQDVFNLLLAKGLSLIFMVVFFVQIINSLVIALNTYYHSGELEVLMTSPVSRTSLFFSRLFMTHLRASWMLLVFGIPLIVSSGMLYHAGVVYYLSSIVLTAVFFSIPVNIGIGVTLFMSAFFHVRKLRRFLLSTGIVAVVLLITMLRFFRPERFVNPELFANATFFLIEMKKPSFILLPNRWLSESIHGFRQNSLNIDTLIFISLLFLTSYITTLLLLSVFKRFHYRGWMLMQEGGAGLHAEGLKQRKGPVAWHETGKTPVMESLLKGLGMQTRVLMIKDLVHQFRDSENVHQYLILFSLIVIYLFSIASLPMNWEEYELQIRYMVSFFNLGLILIIIASLCSRIAYQSVLKEGEALWLLKTAPLTPQRFVLTKFLSFAMPLFMLGQALTAVSSWLIGTELILYVLESLTVGIMSLSLACMAVFFGVSDLRLVFRERDQGQAREGSLALMLSSVILIIFTLSIEVVPIFYYFLEESEKGVLGRKAFILTGGAVLIVLLINTGIVILLIRSGIKKFRELQVE